MINIEKDKIKKIFFEKNQQFGRGQFYQSLPKIGITGQRSTKNRIRIYNLKKYLNSSTKVLDVGCNCGFFSLTMSDFVKSIDGIEPNSKLYKISMITKNFLGVNNCKFYNLEFNKFSSDIKYDCIFSFAVHFWVKLSFYSYVKRLSKLLNFQGKIIFESHELNIIDRLFNLRLKIFYNLGFKIIEEGICNEKKDLKRKFVILEKKKNFDRLSLFRIVNAFVLCKFIHLYVLNTSNILKLKTNINLFLKKQIQNFRK